jgi:D-threo-aldose 1-dehydrogenase
LYGYGLSETRLNRFLREKPREDYVLSTKIGRLLRVSDAASRDGIGKWFDIPTRVGVYDYGYDATMRCLEISLERLGVDRVDILYAHDLDVFNHGTAAALQERLDEFMAGGYRALLDLRDQGVIRAFGAGVNEWEPCQWMLERRRCKAFFPWPPRGALGLWSAGLTTRASWPPGQNPARFTIMIQPPNGC